MPRVGAHEAQGGSSTDLVEGVVRDIVYPARKDQERGSIYWIYTPTP